MLQNYFKTAFRNLKKRWVYTLINVFGLGLALACCMVAYLISAMDWEFDAMHTNTEHVYRLNSLRSLEGRTQQWATVPLALGPRVRDESAAVEDMVRFMGASTYVQYGDETFSEYIHYADSNFLDFFDFPLKHGDKQAFADRASVYLSADAATKYFGDEMPLGKQLQFHYSDSLIRDFQVAGVFEDVPINSSLQFDFLISLPVYLDVAGMDESSWKNRRLALTFVRKHPEAELSLIAEQLKAYLPLHNEALENFQITQFYPERFDHMKKSAEDMYGTYTNSSVPKAMLVGTAVLGVLVLLLACFNFTNTAIAMAGGRLKEIGIRKTLGGLRAALTRQFLMENLLLAFLALIAGLLFAELLVPAYNRLWPLELETNYLERPHLIGFAAALLLVVALLGGSYPAFYLSKFQPTEILKGTQRLGGTNWFMRVLLTLQFSIAILTLMAGVIFTQNARYQEDVELGYEEEGVVFLNVDTQSEFERMKQAMEQFPHTQAVAGSSSHLGWSSGLNTVDLAGKQYEVRSFLFGPHYLKTMGLSLLEGRGFRANSEAEREHSMIVNELFVHELGLKTPIGQRVKIGDKSWNIIGVVKNFMAHGLYVPIQPAIIRLADPEAYRYLVARVPVERETEAYALMESKWQELVPGKPFAGYYQAITRDDERRDNASITSVFLFLSVLVLLLSVAGLYAMVSLNILKRNKEMSIRKVLGASIGQLSFLIQREFLLILLLASVLGVPLGYWGTNLLLEEVFVYHTDLTAVPTVITLSLVFAAALATVGYKIYQAAVANPADRLRAE